MSTAVLLDSSWGRPGALLGPFLRLILESMDGPLRDPPGPGRISALVLAGEFTRS
jgi:hypothetical protein